MVESAGHYTTHMGADNPLCPRCETETEVKDLEADDCPRKYVALVCPNCGLSCPIGVYQK